MRTAKIQNNLNIRKVWSESLISAGRKAGPPAIHRAPIDDSDQTVRMRKLI